MIRMHQKKQLIFARASKKYNYIHFAKMYIIIFKTNYKSTKTKTMKQFFIVFSMVALMQTLSAQQNYTWSEYGLSFSLADDFKEEVNNAEEFSAAGDGMNMAIIPFKDADFDDADITAFTLAIAASMDLGRIDDVNVIDINGFQGGYAEGEKDGAKIFIMGLIDPDSETNFFVLITFMDQDANATQEAINICQSIHKM